MGSRKYYINENYFDNWSSNMAYILGFITADGHVRKTELNFGLNPKDIEVLEFIRSEIGSNQPIKTTTFYNKKVKKHYTDIRLCLCSTALCKILRERFGLISHKTGNENICFDIPSEFKWDYIRGLFDGDGNVRADPTLESNICSSSFIFINQLKELCDNLGKISKSKSGIYLLSFFKADSLIFRDKIYSNNSFRLQRKFNIFNSYTESDFKYTIDEMELITNNLDDLSKVAKLLGVKKENIESKARRMGVLEPKFLVYTKEEIDFILNNTGIISNKEIAKKLNRKLRSVNAKICSLNKKGNK